MELFGIPIWLILLLVMLVLVATYVRYMSATHDTFKKMGIDTPPVTMVLGHFHLFVKLGLMNSQTEFHTQFREKKVYGLYDMRDPVLMLRDLEMVKDVMVKESSKFINRRIRFPADPPLDHSMLMLKDEHWKRVRSSVSPTFTSGRLKRMVPHIQHNANILVDTIREKQERNEEMELKDLLQNFTLDVIASTAFGYETNSQTNPDGIFVTHMKKIMTGHPLAILLIIFVPPLVKLLKLFNIHMFPKKSLDFLVGFVDAAVETRRQTGAAKATSDFLDLVVNAEKLPEDETSEVSSLSSRTAKPSGLSRLEIQAQAVTFITAGMETVASTTSFAIFMLANNPACLQKLKEEIDTNLGKQPADVDNIQSLHYLDMCINETLRMYPPALAVDRVCNEDVVIEGIEIPKGMIVVIPAYAIHHDPDIWPNPYEFDPERFSPENKESRSPYAHLPFGHGPRNCIGMRLGLLETKLAVVAVLQSFTPVVCAKTVYPIKLNKLQVKAEDGLWVKMDVRK